MRVIIAKDTGEIRSAVSASSVPLQMHADEQEEIIEDDAVIVAILEGRSVQFNRATQRFEIEPVIVVDEEKAVLYEAVAHLYEEIEHLKGGGGT